MSNGVTMTFPHGDVQRLFRAMEYASQTLSVDMGKAMRQGVRHLLSSIAASTRVAPKYREINERPSFTSRRRDLKAFGVTGWFGKPRTFQSRLYFSKDLRTAKERHAKIGHRGLAKLTWKMAGRRINERLDGVSFPTLSSAITGKIAAEHTEGTANFKGDDVFAEIHNKLPYIRQALHGGPQDVTSAFDRAARALATSVDRQIVKRMGLGTLDKSYRARGF